MKCKGKKMMRNRLNSYRHSQLSRNTDQKQNKMMLHAQLHSSYPRDIISTSALNIIIFNVFIIGPIYL